jgi:xanthine/uracil/vitamin C permease (AzgA family)
MIDARLQALKGIKPHEYALRFLFGGLCTVAAGLIAKRYGAGIGGLFLAFPAIFPAGASLIEKHEREHKEKAGLEAGVRGRQAAGLDAAGASLGCLGLITFAYLVWKGLPGHRAWVVISLGAAGWFCTAFAAWLLRKSRLLRGTGG